MKLIASITAALTLTLAAAAGAQEQLGARRPSRRCARRLDVHAERSA